VIVLARPRLLPTSLGLVAEVSFCTPPVRVNSHQYSPSSEQSPAYEVVLPGIARRRHGRRAIKYMKRQEYAMEGYSAGYSAQGALYSIFP
jgi:hypothetical protein